MGRPKVQSTLEVSEAVRARLVGMGIPAVDHTSELLARFFPPGFNVTAAGLDAEQLAQALIYLADRGIVTVSWAGSGSVLKKVEPGWHFCQFYRSFDELLTLISPYVAEGLHNHEACLWVVPDVITADQACAALSELVPDVAARVAAGQLEILPYSTWYLDASGNLKSFEEISAALVGRQDQAIARGFRFLRAAGDTGWVSGTEQSRHFVDYERKIAAALGATQVAAVCTYRAGVTADELVAIVAAHQSSLRTA
jgi:hypothetical protein